MHIWRSLVEVPAGLGPTCVTVGNFDGVHRGHTHVIGRASSMAQACELPVVAVTFDPHPMAVLRPDHAPTSLTTMDERVRLLESAGVDHVLVLPFDREMASWTPNEFITRVLVDALHARVVVVGANFRFGNRAAGDVTTLRESRTFEVDAVDLDGGPQVWSSTYIRTCLGAGDIAGAEEALGRPISMRGIVVQGDRRGRELGFPTANVPARGLVPADGVYAGWLSVVGATDGWPAAISVGTNPTFEGQRERRVEAYALDRDDLDLYGVLVEITFVERLRGMVRFDGVEGLIKTMQDDVSRARTRLAGLPRPTPSG